MNITDTIRHHRVEVVIALIGLAVSLRAFYPGMMTNDSVNQYRQAVAFTFEDWHPPVMAFIWALVKDWIPGPFGMLVVDCVLYWTGLLLFAVSLKGAGRNLSFSLLAIGYLPFTIGLLGVIWKDVLQGTIWIFTMGLLAYAHTHWHKEIRWTRIISCGLLVLGAMFRHNAVIALPPLIFLALSGQSRRRALATALLSPLIVVLVSGGLSYGLLNAAHSNSHLTILVFDIGGISDLNKMNLFEKPWDDNHHSMITTSCYSPASVETYLFGSCSFVWDTLKRDGEWNDSSDLVERWTKAVSTYPGSYVRHRLTYYWTFLWHPQVIFPEGTEKNRWGYEFHRTAMYSLMRRSADILQTLHMFDPGFWLVVGVVVIVLGLKASPNVWRNLAIFMNISGIIYLLGYAVAGITSEFRYAYWSVLAASFSIPALIAAYRDKRMQ